MGATTAEVLYRSLERGNLGGVFLVQGEEEYLKEEAVQAILRSHLDPATRDFNLDQLRGQGLDPETLASVCQTPPMLAAWRVVLVRDAQHLTANARIRAVVETLIAKTVPGLALVLETSTGDKSKARLWQQLERAARTLTFDAMPAADVPGWLMGRAAEHGVKLEPAAARAMTAAIGTGLGVLHQEMAKLVEFAGGRGRITTADVEAVVGILPTQNRWDWFDLVGDRRFAEARAGLPVLLDAGESGVGLLVGLGTHMLRLGAAASGDDRALEAALPPNQRWLAGRLRKQARGWTRSAIVNAISDLLRADRLLKSTGLEDRHVLEELLLRLQQGRAAA